MNKPLRIALYSFASLLLVGTVTYTFFVNDPPVVGDVLEKCPSTSLKLLNKEGNFRIEEHAGKPVLINFWAKWCGSCVAEMPSINDLALSYGDELYVLAVGDAVRESEKTALSVIEGRDWTDFAIDFAMDVENNDFFVSLGGGSGRPYTVLVDQEGYVAKTYLNAIDIPLIKADIDALLAK